MLPPMFATAELMSTLLAKPLGEEYRYLIPDLSGHGEASHQTYESAEQEAETLYKYLKDQNLTNIKLAFGASLGGIVLMELLRKPDLSFGQLFFEGVSFCENAGLIGATAKAVLLRKHKKAVAHPEVAVKKMRQLYGEKAAETMAKQMVSIQEKSLEHIIWDCTHVRLPKLSSDQQKRCVFAYGEKESGLKMAEKIRPKRYPMAAQIVWPGQGHCTKITENPLEYVKIVREYL